MLSDFTLINILMVVNYQYVPCDTTKMKSLSQLLLFTVFSGPPKTVKRSSDVKCDINTKGLF